MHVLLTLNLAADDGAIRDFIRIAAPLPTHVQHVLCQNARYADMIYARWVNRRVAKGLPCGGGWQDAY